MKSFAVVATAIVALGLPLVAVPAEAQIYTSQGYADQGYAGQSYGGQSYSYGQTYSSGHAPDCGQSCGGRRYDQGRRRSYSYSYNGQRDVPGDYRCDAYWDAGRTDCSAAWRDQRPWRRSSTRSYSSNTYGYGGPAVYQGEYGRPDVVYSGGAYSEGGRYRDPYGHDHSGYGQYGRDPQRINWCCIQYRSYDPATGYYTAYSGERVFCG